VSSRPGPTRPHASGSDSSETFAILVVCTANRCRSPAIVSVLNQGAGGYPGLSSDGVRLNSACTSDEEGVPIDAKTKKALRRAGYTAPDALSRSVSPEMIASADLILTASRRHRTQVVRMAPDALARTYTAREFARYCAPIVIPVSATVLSPADRLKAAMRLAHQQRGMSFPSRLEDDDIPDPIGGSRWAHSRMVRLIVATATPILAIAFREPPSVAP
jgi:protein-tyrosine phosphatase